MRLLFSLLFLALFSCTTLGPQFKPLENKPKDKAVVYIYRPPKFSGGGGSPTILLDHKDLGEIPSGSYAPLIMDEGKHHLLLKGMGYSVGGFEFNVKAGEVYYARLDMSLDNGKKEDLKNRKAGVPGMNSTSFSSEEQQMSLMNALDLRAQSEIFNPGIFFVKPELAREEISQTKLHHK